MGLKVIIADDDALARTMIEAIVERDEELEFLGSAEDAVSAVALALEHRPDVAVLDWTCCAPARRASSRRGARRRSCCGRSTPR